MKAIFSGNSEDALKFLNEERLTNNWELNYEHTLLVAFWLAVQKENCKVATNLMNHDLFLRYITTLAIKGQKEQK